MKAGAQEKVKIIFTYIQITTSFQGSLEVEWPPVLLEWARMMNFVNLDLMGSVKLE